MSDEIEIKNELGKLSDKIKEHGEKALAEAAKGVAMSTGVKQTVDELLVKQGELQAQVTELEQKAARNATTVDTSRKSAGQLVVENAEFKKLHESGELRRKGGRFSVELEQKAVLTAQTGAAIIADRQPGVIPIPQRRLTIRDLIAPGSTSSNLITYMKETLFTNNAAPTAEGVRKPESTMTLAQSTAPVIKIPHFMKASSEILDDYPALQSLIEERLMYGLKLVEEDQMLKGSGVGNNLNGIYTQATAFAAPFVVTTPTLIDTLRLMLLQAELALFPSDGVVLNPVDWAKIELTKDSTANYIVGNPFGTITPTMWGRSVVATPALTADTALVGAFRLGAQVFDRKQAALTIATENEDDFVNNLVTLLIEERLALVVNRPAAFIKNANFDGV